MWRLGTPMQISHDINDEENPHGVPPIYSHDFFLLDEFGAYLLDAVGDYLVQE